MNPQQTPVPTIWTTGWTTVFNTGTWRNQLPVHQFRPAPCHVSCPLGNEIPSWVASIKDGSEEEYRTAFEQIVECDPFPSILGRVCHHPCETNCNRQALEQPIAINSLEQFIGDMAIEKGWKLPAAGEPQGKKVAVVGSGPAGLSAAYRLRRFGYDVTIFEAREDLGGLLTNGIPEYRLPKKIAKAEIQRMLDLGIEVRTGEEIDGVRLEQLSKDYDAVFLGVGAGKPKTLPYLGDDPRIMIGLNFLAAASHAKAPELGEKVVVVGGGSAAMDVARTVRRMGKSVQVIAVEGRDQLPAQEEEVQEALEEGISLHDGAMISSVDTSGPVLKLACKKATLDPDAPAGVIRPLPVEGSDFQLEADNIIVTIGQDPAVEKLASAVDVEKGVLAVNDNCRTNLPNVFAGGDAATMDRYVSVAVGQGKKAAWAIAEYLGHPDVEPLPVETLEDAVQRNEINPFYFVITGREERGKKPVAERLAGQEDVKIGFSEEQALREAARCMSCGTCIECDNCFVFCSDMAVQKAPDTAEHYRILEQFCKGCGLCAAECPRGCIVMKQESK